MKSDLMQLEMFLVSIGGVGRYSHVRDSIQDRFETKFADVVHFGEKLGRIKKHQVNAFGKLFYVLVANDARSNVITKALDDITETITPEDRLMKILQLKDALK